MAINEMDVQELSAEEKRKLTTIVLYASLIQPIDFSIFQVRAILLKLINGPVPAPVEEVADYSQPALLAVAAVAIITEIWVRSSEWQHANREQIQAARLLLGLAVFKLITIGLFCANDYYELKNTSNRGVDKAAGACFIALFFLEMIISSTMSAITVNTHYLSVAFFVDFFLKTGIFAAAILQYFPQTELQGYIVAAFGFALVAVNVGVMLRHHKAEIENADAEQRYLFVENSEEVVGLGNREGINANNINNEPSANQSSSVSLSGRIHSFFHGLGQRAQNVRPYLEGNRLSPA